MPTCLAGVQESILADRGEDWYLARAAPSRTSRGGSQAKRVCLDANVVDDVNVPTHPKIATHRVSHVSRGNVLSESLSRGSSGLFTVVALGLVTLQVYSPAQDVIPAWTVCCLGLPDRLNTNVSELVTVRILT